MGIETTVKLPDAEEQVYGKIYEDINNTSSVAKTISRIPEEGVTSREYTQIYSRAAGVATEEGNFELKAPDIDDHDILTREEFVAILSERGYSVASQYENDPRLIETEELISGDSSLKPYLQEDPNLLHGLACAELYYDDKRIEHFASIRQNSDFNEAFLSQYSCDASLVEKTVNDNTEEFTVTPIEV